MSKFDLNVNYMRKRFWEEEAESCSRFATLTSAPYLDLLVEKVCSKFVKAGKASESVQS